MNLIFNNDNFLQTKTKKHNCVQISFCCFQKKNFQNFDQKSKNKNISGFVEKNIKIFEAAKIIYRSKVSIFSF